MIRFRAMHPSCMKPILALLCAMLLCSATVVFAEPETEGAAPPAVRSETWRNFENLYNTIRQAEQDLDSLRKKLHEVKSDAERTQLRNDIDLMESNIDSLRLAWELWATGGVDLQMFYPQKEEKFDWREEMQSALEPILIELRRLTERPRKMERLRSEQDFYQKRLNTISAALKNIVNLKDASPAGAMQTAFGELEARWRQRFDEYHSQLALINLQLTELSSPSQSVEERAAAVLKELLSGRFVNLLLAILAAALTYMAMRAVNRLYTYLVKPRGRRPFLARLAHLSFVLMTAVLSLLAAMGVLYTRGDWILLGLLIIVLMGAALTLQRTLPAFVKEARILLNLGPAREGERVIYNGLPWKIQALNMYSTLVNPALRGGIVRLPARELTGLISRRFDDKEPWFPTRENDYVLLNDDRYCQVVLQTPEVVQVRIAGAVRTFPVAAFLDSHPQNLSLNGFAITMQFGVDYRHQADVTGDILKKLEAFIASRLKDSRVGAHLKECYVEFDEAATSSLNFFIWATFSGEAADSYLYIRRLLQRLAVEACNAHGWTIPFNQMTVHIAGDTSTSGADGNTG